LIARVQVRRVARQGTGHTPSRSVPEYWIPEECTIPWLTLADVWQLRDGSVSTIVETAEKISPRGLANSSAVVHPAGTVAFSRTASVGFACVLGVDMATSQDFVTWTPGDGLSSRYLLWALRGLRHDILGRMQGSTHQTIYMSDLNEVAIPLHSIEDQCRIADFLDDEVGRIDELIAEQGSRQRDLQIEWFGSELIGSLLPEAAPPGWSRGRLKYLFEFERNGVWGEEPLGDENDVLCVRVADFDRTSFTVDSTASTVRNVLPAHRSRRLLAPGDVLLEKSGGTPTRPVGCAVTFMLDRPAVCSNFVAALRPVPEVDARWAGLLLAAKYQARLNAPFVKQTTGIQNLDSGEYLATHCLVPPRAEQVQIGRRAERLIDLVERRVHELDRQIDLLQERRQALVMAAVTGGIDTVRKVA